MERTFNKQRYHGVISIAHIVLKWIIGFFYIIIGIAVIGTIVVLFIPKSALDFNMANLEHINIQFTNIMYEINGGFFTGIANVKNLLLLLGLVGLVNLGFVQFIMIELKKLVASVREEMPFKASNAMILRNMGIVFLIASVVVSLANAWLMMTAINTFDVYQATINFSINLQYLFMGVLVLILAYVFSYGSFLQEEHDQTI